MYKLHISVNEHEKTTFDLNKLETAIDILNNMILDENVKARYLLIKDEMILFLGNNDKEKYLNFKNKLYDIRQKENVKEHFKKEDSFFISKCISQSSCKNCSYSKLCDEIEEKKTLVKTR